ncbi:MAG: hypothetical protein K0R66_294 [Gammaproteobacteria bacterium]|jgi:Na+-translocating ferredoxin:NAD+ oxidoreductase RnfD subunit|nr:hypothetical protein [Gammaproteobacteria bacterium]
MANEHSPESLIHSSNSLFNSVVSIIKEFLELAHLEAKFSCQNLIIVMGLLFFTGMLITASWIALLIGAAFVLHEHGIHWSVDLIVIFLVNVGLLSICIGCLKYFFKNVGFPSTLRNLSLLKEQTEN